MWFYPRKIDIRTEEGHSQEIMGTDSKVVTGDYYDGTANPPDSATSGKIHICRLPRPLLSEVE